jgi:hypothetical protein
MDVQAFIKKILEFFMVDILRLLYDLIKPLLKYLDEKIQGR